MSLMPDVTDLLYDPDVGAKPFTVLRRTGEWIAGRFRVAKTETIKAIGVMLPPEAEQLATFPEGERRKGVVAIYTKTLLYLSDGECISDDITWMGEQYKVMRVERWDEYGYCVAYAQKR